MITRINAHHKTMAALEHSMENTDLGKKVEDLELAVNLKIKEAAENGQFTVLVKYDSQRAMRYIIQQLRVNGYQAHHDPERSNLKISWDFH